MIVAFCGSAHSGKTTASNILVHTHGFAKISFADALKDAVAPIFGWDRKRLAAETPEDRAWREVPDPFWSNVFGKSVTPRWVLQNVGTELFRTRLHPDIWTRALQRTVLNNPDIHYTIDDCRFPNEFALLREMGAAMVWIVRPPIPDWQQVILDGVHPDARNSILDKQIRAGVHQSEIEWMRVGPEAFDLIVHNDSTVKAYENQIRALPSQLFGH
jgi:hypothetical protein